MDSHDPQNMGTGSGARDLWKTVLDEVATDAAARRARMLQKQGDKRTAVELDLLKRILIAVESRGDQSATLKRILESVQSAPTTDLSAPLLAIQEGIEALARKLAARPKKAGDDAETVAAISQAVVDALQPLLTPPSNDASQAALLTEIGKLLQQRASEQHAFLQRELTTQLEKLPAPAAPAAPPDLTPQLDAILSAVQSPPARERAQQLAQQQAALLQSILEAVQRKPDATQTTLLRELSARLDALPRPVDPSPQLQAILDSLRALPTTAPAAQHDPKHAALLGGIAEQVAAIAQQSHALSQQNEALAAKADALAAKTDAIAVGTQALSQRAESPDTARIDAILDELKRRPVGDHADSLKQIAQQLESLDVVRQQANRLDALAAALQDLPRHDLQPLLHEVISLLKAPRNDETLHAKLDEAITSAKAAAQPQLAARLDELLAELRAPKVDAHADLLARIHAAVTQKSESASDLNPRFDELLSRMTSLESPRPFEAKLDQMASEAKARAAKDDELLTRMLGESRDSRAASDAALKQVADELGRSLATAAAAITSKLDQLESASRTQAQAANAAPVALDQISARLSELATDDRQLQAIGHVLAMLQAQANRGDFELLQRIAAAAEKPADTGVSEKLESILAAVQKPADPHVAATLDQILDVLTAQPASAPSPDAAAIASSAAAQVRDGVRDGVRDELRAATDALRKQVESVAAGVREEWQNQAAALNERLAAQEKSHAGQLASNLDAERQNAAALREELRQIIEAIRSLPQDGAAQGAASLDPRQLELLHEILGEVRSPAARARQEQMLEEIAAGLREQPAQQQEHSRRLSSELRQLTDATRQTQQSLQRVLDAVTARRDPVVIAAPVSAAPAPASAAAVSAPALPLTTAPRPYAWPGAAAPRNRFPAAAAYAVAAAAVGIFVLLLINTFADKDPKPQNPPNANLAHNGGNTGTNPPGTAVIPDVPRPAPITDGGKSVAGANTNISKDGGAPATKDSGKSFVDISKSLLPKQPITDGDGKLLVSPTVADLLKDAINKPRGVLAIDQATQVVLLFHTTSGKAAENAALLTDMKAALAKLRDGQKYTILFTENDRPVEVPPAGLKAATNRERAFSEDWIARNIAGDAIRPGNNPTMAIDLAMSYEPDLLWLFTDGMPSGKPGQLTPAELVQKFKSANARGRTHIYTTVIASAGPVPPAAADAHQLLKSLAEEHGGAFSALNTEPEKATGGP